MAISTSGPSSSASTSSALPRETAISIPCRDIHLPGILARADPDRPSKELALILHGQMAHKNQIYHKPLVKALAQRRRMDSFRFDFAHALYNQPGWEWHMAQFQRDVEEIKVVVQYLREKLGYSISLIVAHSKGSLASWMYLSQIPDPPRLYVNLSGRYDMQRANQIMGPRYFPAFEQQGYFEWKAKAAGQPISVRVTPAHFKEFVEHDTSFVKRDFPKSTHVLTIHGDKDEVVPVEDGQTYHSILSERPGPGTSAIHIMEGGDHNFIGRYDEVVETIVSWLDRLEPLAGGASSEAAKKPGKL